MKAVKVKMPNESALKEELRIRTEGNVWFFLDDEALARLRIIATDVKKISNLLMVQYENTQILIGPHAWGWWRMYSLDGDLFFREAADPESVILMKG